MKLSDWMEKQNKAMEARADRYKADLKIKKSVAMTLPQWLVMKLRKMF